MNNLKHFHPIQRFKKFGLVTRLIIAIAVVASLAGGYVGWNSYQDARNAELLRNIVADFDQLEADLEEELGVDVEDKSGCFTTSEKFNEGKTACFVNLGYIGDEYIKDGTRKVVSTRDYFENYRELTDRYSEYTYQGWSCNLGLNKDSGFTAFGLECPIPVRKANQDLVRELFFL